MKLIDALDHSSIFDYKGRRYSVFLYQKKEFRSEDSRKKFTIICNDHPMPDKTYEFSSLMDVKPVIRMRA